MDKNKILIIFSILVFVGAILIQYTQNEIPQWLISALGMALVYVFGLHIEPKNDDKE